MHTLEGVINAFTDFLNSAQSVGAVKEYTLNFQVQPLTNDCMDGVVKTALKQLTNALSALRPNEQTASSDEAVISPETNDATEVRSVPGNIEMQQIRVDHDELFRRINAFTERKRKEMAETVCKEFCNTVFLDNDPLIGQTNSCARVDAVYSHWQNHVKTSQVYNPWGPQILRGNQNQVLAAQERADGKVPPLPRDFEERLKNVESHLSFVPDGKSRKFLYSWLRKLEDRILFLEGLAPEYFDPKGMKYSSPQKKSKMERVEMLTNLSVEDLDRRKEQLKEDLKSKSNRSVRCML